MMAASGRFDNGVRFYTTGELRLNVSFPENEVSCQWCPFLEYDRGLDRYSCSLTNRTLYSRFFIPEECPIEFPHKVEDPPADPIETVLSSAESASQSRRPRKKSATKDEPVA